MLSVYATALASQDNARDTLVLFGMPSAAIDNKLFFVVVMTKTFGARGAPKE